MIGWKTKLEHTIYWRNKIKAGEMATPNLADEMTTQNYAGEMVTQL